MAMLRVAYATVFRSRVSLFTQPPVFNFSQQQSWIHLNKSVQQKFEEFESEERIDKLEIKQIKNKGQSPEDPILVASPTEKCIVGCTCSPDACTVNWFYVNEGDPQTCDCGYFFKLVKVDPKVEAVPEYSRIMYVDDKKDDLRSQDRGPSFLKRIFSKTSKNVSPPASMSSIKNKQNL
uniref:uncharacterized protein LOC120346059 n=1 Tax=Styela clava TaxID=7725 RepID=UPI001939F06F|nr:uncharacterized protein LOC120346059 [Styela clava]